MNRLVCACLAWLALGLLARYVAVQRADFPPLLTSYINGTAVWCFAFAALSLVLWWKKRRQRAAN